MRNYLEFWGGLLAAAVLGTGVLASDIETSAGPMRITAVATGLEEPWAIAFLPDGSVLITERGGRLLRLTDGKTTPISGLPEVAVKGQGGLLDVMVPQDFETSREIWLSYASKAKGGLATAVGKGRLSADASRLEDFRTLFVGEGYSGERHFGSRLVEAADGTIFLTTGERGTGPQGMQAQNPALAAGKIIHLRRDGSPATHRAGWLPGVYSLGHRNLQGAAIAPDGRLLTVEHGARGGDELNSIKPGANYGWPVITYGVDYSFLPIGEGSAKPGMEQPLHYWDPSIAPSGLMIYSGKLIPEWAGDIFTGSLNSGFISRLDPDSAVEAGYAEEQIVADETGRVRDVVESLAGEIWFLSVIDGALYRLRPVP
ncbi:glucose sorbosone dehydrogenase [Gemmobacter lanyuensis]|uniref:Glucose sorbosone dehydrogenase n=1 Tax=Gemmobacter lanyuensis TaxID=1054497 RepID=A0A918IMQ2_9RHOB|nr:PQQ-dependent sugar dehydrogenase [Gemmobacter lanyuensis]GGW21898.1 glucose sorbosone dehydrogenase [Gemmobacter lanyuensis]